MCAWRGRYENELFFDCWSLFGGDLRGFTDAEVNFVERDRWLRERDRDRDL